MSDLSKLVKPLVWRKQSHDCSVAETEFGSAAVQNESHALAPDRWGWWMVGSYEDDSPSGYEVTEVAAKAAAQVDYAGRIISALDLDVMTASPAPVVTDAMERAIDNALDDFFKPSEYLLVGAIRAALIEALANLK